MVQARFARQPAEPVYCTTERPDADFEDADASRARLDLDAYQREIEMARSAVHGRALDEAVQGRTGDADISLRWIFLHMIGEYARHNGHADLVRERLDGATGQ